MKRVLTHDIYTVSSMQQGLAAFVRHCQATIEHGRTESTITIAGDEASAAELLNYILALSAQETLA